jgi:hypothetical protein
MTMQRIKYCSQRTRIYPSLALAVLLVSLTFIYHSAAQMNEVVLDQGTFVVQQNQIQLGQGNFALVQLSSSVVQLVDQMRFAPPQASVTAFNATIQMDEQLNPRYYVLNIADSQGQQMTIVVQIEGDTAHMLTADRNGTSTGTSFQSSSGFVLLDNNLFGQFAVLYRRALAALDQGASSFQSTALVPQAAEAVPLQAARGKTVEIQANGKISQVDSLTLTLAGGQFTLLGQGNQFIGLVAQGQSTPTAFRSDLFPQGFTITNR